MRSCVEPEEADDDLDPHLYLFTASSFLEGLVKIGRSHRILERACQVQDGMPFFLQVCSIWPYAGGKEGEIHEKLRPFRVEGGAGMEWYRLSVHSANAAIGNILFESRACAKPCAET